MKILQVGAGNLYGGIETCHRTLARCRHLCPEMEMHFAYFFDGKIFQQIQETGATVHRLPEVRYSRPWTTFAARRKLQEIIQQQNYDIVIAHELWVHGIIAGGVTQTKAKLILWLHDYHAKKRLFDRFSLRIKPAAIIVNSDFCQQPLHQFLPGIPCKRIYCPVEMPALDPTARERIRQQMKVDDHTKVFLQASRIESWKGHHHALHTFAKLNEHPNWQLWFAGEVKRPHEIEYQKQLIDQIQKSNLTDRVRWIGFQNPLTDWMLAADWIIQFNDTPEPFGIVAIESLYCGRPFLSANSGGPKEIIDNMTGICFESTEYNENAKTIQGLLTTGWPDLSEIGPNRAKEIADPQDRLQELELYLQTIIQFQEVKR